MDYLYINDLLKHSVNEVDGFLLLLIHDFSVDFGGLDIGVSHQFACREQVLRQRVSDHCAEGVT
jgi:hypothetical protein